MSASEALPKAVAEGWFERFGVEILDGIGTTEILHIFLSNRAGGFRHETSGMAVPGYALRLEDMMVGSAASTKSVNYWWCWFNRGRLLNQRERSIGTFKVLGPERAISTRSMPMATTTTVGEPTICSK